MAAAPSTGGLIVEAPILDLGERYQRVAASDPPANGRRLDGHPDLNQCRATRANAGTVDEPGRHEPPSSPFLRMLRRRHACVARCHA